ncbi:hypothetical protein [Streptosporangium sp. V21-05]|uniref:hypothetical protein n=1 Tax=Streptosporangium sp. V21-05 TaxID=3446115 RepID=UPI003F535585
MSGYTTATRSHDAEWLLQRELQFNDILLQTGRRNPRRGKDYGNKTSLPLTPPTPAEEAAAARRVREIANRGGWNGHWLAEALDMLGLQGVAR